jgi:hypothetical protein
LPKKNRIDLFQSRRIISKYEKQALIIAQSQAGVNEQFRERI